MSFSLAIAAHSDAAHLNAWFTDLQHPTTGCTCTAGNLTACQLFPVGNAPTNIDLTIFAGRLPAPGTPPTKEQWRDAANGPAAPGACVAHGPDATPPHGLVRTQPLAALQRHSLSAIVGIATADDWAAFIQSDPAGAEALRPYLRPGSVVRGHPSVAFWADKTAVDAFRAANGTAGGLRNYLGIDDGPTGSAPVVVIDLDDTAAPPRYPRKVPTGFDAFDNPYFIPQPPGSVVGVVRNIVPAGQPGAGHTNANEVVTGEVSFGDVRFEPTPVLP